MSLRLAVVLWTLALALAGLAAGIVVSGGDVDHFITELGLPILVGLTFVAVGLFSWFRTPANRTGALMTAVGFSWFLGALTGSDVALLHTIGSAVGGLVLGWFVWLLLAFPDGRLGKTIDRAIVAGRLRRHPRGAALPLLFDDRQELPAAWTVPANLLLVDPNKAIVDAINILFAVLGIALCLAVITRLVIRYRRAAPPVRRAMQPVYVTGAILILVGVVTSALGSHQRVRLARRRDLPRAARRPAVVPLRAASRAAGAGGGRAARRPSGRAPGPGDLRQAIARALGDPPRRCCATKASSTASSTTRAARSSSRRSAGTER